MFWGLLLCHLVADYPLQTDGVVEAKKRLPGLCLHVSIHLLTMLVVIVGLIKIEWRAALPWIIALTGCHFLIDLWKNILAKLKPGWVIFGYLQDQVLHLVSIALVAYWAELRGGPPMLEDAGSWVVPALAFVLVTHAWFVTERVLAYRDPPYQRWVNAQSWPRMIGRAAMLGASFLGWSLWGLLVLLGGFMHQWLDLSGTYRLRAIVTDACVVAAVMSLSSLASI